MTETRWIELEGAANVRDVGGLPTVDGGAVRSGRLIRSDNLQGLTDADVRLLVDELGVRAVADLRSGVELRAEGDGPMTREPAVTITHLSLFAEPDSGDADRDAEGAVILPWSSRDAAQTEQERRRGAAGVYLGYLDDRPDSLLTALRMIAHTEGATIVHCAAGKDRTGVVVAFALAEVGVTREAIVADYERSAERIVGILTRLLARQTYRADLGGDAEVELDAASVAAVAAKHSPRADTMVNLLAELDERYGGASAWLRAHGWTEDDAAALRGALLA